MKNLVTDGSHSAPMTQIRSSWKTDQSRNNDESISKNIAISIDEFIASSDLVAFNVLKIDVDGYDFKVLKGAKQAIIEFKPLIYIELGEFALNQQGDSVRDIFNLLIDLGYWGRLASNPDQIIDLETTVNHLKVITHVNAIFMQPQ